MEILELSQREAKDLEQLLNDARTQTLLDALGTDSALHLVGGTVRDVFLKRPVRDLDFASSLPPEALLERLRAAAIKVIPTALKHQTVTAVPIPEESAVEITSFRGAGMSPAGGVRLSNSIAEDLQYRDFTINAMGYNLLNRKVYGVSKSLNDLRKKLVRAVGNPSQRFTEDPLRALRMVRFACLQDFKLDLETKSAAGECVDSLAKISIERIRDEFDKILLSERAPEGIFLLQELGLLAVFLPEVSSMGGFEQNSFHPHTLLRHSVEVMGKTRSDLTLRMAALLHDIGKPASLSTDSLGNRHFFKHEHLGAEITKELLTRMKYSKRFTDNVVNLVATHMRPIECGAAGMRRLLRDTGETYPLWRELKEADASSVKLDQNKLKRQLKDFDHAIEKIQEGPDVSPLKNLAIKGQDLIDLGLTPGPRFGEILRALHEQVLDKPELNKKETLIRITREKYI